MDLAMIVLAIGASRPDNAQYQDPPAGRFFYCDQVDNDGTFPTTFAANLLARAARSQVAKMIGEATSPVYDPEVFHRRATLATAARMLEGGWLPPGWRLLTRKR